MFLKTEYSVLSSAFKMKNGIKALAKAGYKAAVLADENLFGYLEFFYACKNNGLKPIVGVIKKIQGIKYLLISKNGEGFTILSEMTSKEKYQKEDNIFFVLLENKKLGELPISPDFVGVDTRVENKDRKILEFFAQKTRTPLLPVNISSFDKEEDIRLINSLRSIDLEKKVDYLGASELSEPISNKLIPQKELVDSLSKELITNLSYLVRECSEDGYKFGNPVPPHFPFVKETAKAVGIAEATEEELFTYMARNGLKERGLDSKEEYKERLEYEIKIILDMKFPGYMLMVQDFINTAKSMGYPTGPGRGSAAGSLVAYAMGITNIDPIENGLIFERFLNPERVSMPDIDMDFCQTGRQAIIDAVIEKYGKENVAQIITFGKLGAKAAIRDAARVLGLPLALADKTAKMVPEKPGITLNKALDENPEISDLLTSDEEAERIWNLAIKTEGFIRNLGVHAAGLVIADIPVHKKAPLTEVNDTQVVVVDGSKLEDVDLIKFDFLGLKTLSVIDKAQKLIKKNHNVDIEFERMGHNDKKTYDLIVSGLTGGVFQLESSGMVALCKDMNPNSFADLTALIALYRPGPMESGMLDSYVARKQGKEEVSYFFDEFEDILKPILEETYGVIVYQEQVMQIVQSIGGFSLAEADLVRRAMGKKKAEEMAKIKNDFANGAEKLGFDKNSAIELFELIEKFAGYGFNKSHSAAYAEISYRTAYLKAHYPAEFFTALMHLEAQDLTKVAREKLARYVSEAARIGIKTSSFDVNTSNEEFDTDGKEIFYSLSALKGVGTGAAPLFKARAKGKFSSLKDFLNRTRSKAPKLNKRVFEALVKAGALDSFGYKRSSLLENSKELLDLKDVELEEGKNEAKENLDFEKEVIGFYVSDPFEKARNILNKYKIPPLSSLEEGKQCIFGLISDFSKKRSKKGKDYGVISIFYNGDTTEILAFNRALSSLENADLSRPVILSVDKKDNGTIFLNEVIPTKSSTLEKCFLKA